MPDPHPESVPSPPARPSSGRTERALGDEPTWTAAHYCVHCCYAHVVALPEEPRAGATYLYSCPISRQDCLITSRDVSVRAIAGAVRGSIPARRIGAD